MIPYADRIWDQVAEDPTTGCWIWTGKTGRDGYGRIGPKLVHRVAYEAVVGVVPHGLELDHLCRRRNCLRPEHLEPVTHRENIKRGLTGAHNARKTHCPQGHPYAGDNLYLLPNGGGRSCRTCQRAHAAAHYQRQREAA